MAPVSQALTQRVPAIEPLPVTVKAPDPAVMRGLASQSVAGSSFVSGGPVSVSGVDSILGNVQKLVADLPASPKADEAAPSSKKPAKTTLRRKVYSR